jgi:hypothetical protein
VWCEHRVESTRTTCSRALRQTSVGGSRKQDHHRSNKQREEHLRQVREPVPVIADRGTRGHVQATEDNARQYKEGCRVEEAQ